MRQLNIALLISEFEDPHTNTLCQGVAQAVRERGYQLYIFPGKFLDERFTPLRYTDYEYQSNCLFQFVSEKHIDVAIVSIGNIAPNFEKEEKLKFLEKLRVPVILISDEIDGYSSVNFDNSTGMLFGIEHLMREHNKKFFGYVSGPRHNLDAMERLSVFEQAMMQNRFVSEQYRIVEGDFNYSCTDVIEELMDSFPQMEVLVCGNDMMCFGAYQVLEKRGLVPGKDIAVMGFDDVPYAAQVVPGLTTVKADPSLIGYEAVKICEKVLEGETFHLMVDTSFVIRESCGCAKRRMEETRTSLEMQANIEALNHCLVDISRNVLNQEEENNEIYRKILESLGRLNVKSVYIYTFEKEKSYKKGEVWDAPEIVQLRAYYKGGSGRVPEIAYQPMPVYYYPVKDEDVVEVPVSQQKISFDDIFSNDFIESNTSGIKVVSMLYAGEEQYGFVLWEVEEDYFGYLGKLSYQISNTIKTNRLLQKKSQMARHLEDALRQVNEKNAILEEISKIDELTQVYNRRGFLDHMKRNVIASENQGKKVVAIYADMDNLKQVNDLFGHEEGDYALYSIGQILRDSIHAVNGKGVVGRIGGDEFCAYVITEVEECEEQIRSQIDELTEELNGNNDKPYRISMSVGMHPFVCSSDIVVSQELEKADEQLYQYKANRIKNVLK